MRETWKGSIRRDYEKSNAGWRKGTGGGGGAPENYENWESRAPELFENYTGTGKSTSKSKKKYLAWIYMADKNATPQDVLYSASGVVPSAARNESGSNQAGRNTPASGRGTPKEDPQMKELLEAQRDANGVSKEMCSAFKQYLSDDQKESSNDDVRSLTETAKLLREEIEAIQSTEYFDEDQKKGLTKGLRARLVEVYEKLGKMT